LWCFFWEGETKRVEKKFEPGTGVSSVSIGTQCERPREKKSFRLVKGGGESTANIGREIGRQGAVLFKKVEKEK